MRDAAWSLVRLRWKKSVWLPGAAATVLLAVLAVRWALDSGHRPSGQLVEMMFGAYPLTVLGVGWIAWSRAVVLKQKLRAAEDLAWKARAQYNDLEEAVERAGPMLSRERREAGEELTQAWARLKQAEDRLRAEIVRADSAEARAMLLSRLEPEVQRLRRENAASDQLARERESWRTLPQGHDISSEAFAAAVASVLR